MSQKRPLKDNEPSPGGTFEDERQWRRDETRRLNQQRRESGNLPDDPADYPVKEQRPFKVREP